MSLVSCHLPIGFLSSVSVGSCEGLSEPDTQLSSRYSGAGTVYLR